MLELTRVTGQGAKERGYHVFFQLIHNRDDPLLKPLGLGGPETYAYIKDSQHKAPGVNDEEFFTDMKEAFTGLGFSDETQMEIFKMVMGIITMGNMEFRDNDDVAEFVDATPAQKAADLLGIDVEELKKPMIIRKIFIGRDVTEATRTAAQARAARDGMVRLMYGRLFKWLIVKINAKLGGGSGSQFFGVLDIAGFESFEVNSLEQLFINLSNEHLQQHFNNFIFKMELADYHAEGVDASNFTFADNKDIIELLDSKGSILSMLDEELAMPKATDQSFCSKVFKTHAKHPRLIVPKFQGAVNFGINHFAGKVDYDCKGFLEKNIDKPPDEAPGLLQGSALALLKEIGDKIAADVAEANATARGKKVKSVSSSFRASLAELIKKLQEAEPHFIRCLKPNQEKVPSKFTSPVAMSQLVCSGVFEAVRIRQSGFSARILFKEFLHRYKLVLPKSMHSKMSGKNAQGTEQDRLKTFMAEMPKALGSVGGMPDGMMILGKTKVFCKSQAKNILEKARDIAITSYVMDIQRLWRGYIVRKRLKGFKMSVAELKTWMQDNPFYKEKGLENTAIHKLKTSEAVEKEVQRLKDIFDKAAAFPLRLPNKDECTKTQIRMENEVHALRDLRLLEKCMDPTEMTKTLARIHDLELPDTPEVAGVKKRMEKLERQLPLLRAMNKGLETNDLNILKNALESVKKLGLGMNPEEWLEGCNGQALADQAYEACEQLKKEKKLGDIRQEQKAAVDKAIEKEKEAHRAMNQETLEEEDESMKNVLETRQRRATMTGLSEECVNKIKCALLGAVMMYNGEEIQKKLKECVDNAVPECEEIRRAHEMLENLQKQDYIAKELRENIVKAGNTNHHADADLLKAMQNLMTHARELSVASDAVAEAQAAMQESVRKRARHTIKGRVFHDVDVEEMDLAEGAYSDLCSFSRLKPKDNWSGHRIARRGPGSESGNDMLTHNKNEIREALTQVPPEKESVAIVLFRKVLGWMHDRPMPESATHTFAHEIVDQVESDACLGDEIFVQLMKQLTKNPSKRSALLGWKLMLLLCQHVSPSAELEEFLRTFFMTEVKNKAEDSVEILHFAKQCIADLNVTSSPDRVKEHHGEVIPVKIMLIDHSMRKLHAPADITLADLGERLAEQLRISNYKDFGFYQLTEGLDTHRMLPEITRLESLTKKWAKLKEATQRSSWLLFKRNFLRVDETLQPGDLMHASLTYRQALWDYLRYPVSEDTSFISEIAATILYTEYDHYEVYLKSNRLGDPLILEQLIPEISLRDQKRSRWAAQVLGTFKQLSSTLDHKEARLSKISRVVSLMQRLKLFGAHYWMGKQIMTVPPNKASLPDAPEQMCKVNPKAPIAQYWVCVDLFGIRFVAVDSKPGSSFQRGFLFNEEAVERVLSWGAKGDTVQLVVTTVNSANPTSGRVPMTIALQSPAAMDIAYAVHLIHSKL